MRRSIYELVHGGSIGLTFAGLHALKPPVISVSVASTPAVLIPSTSRGATTESAELLKLTALWALHRISRGDGWRTDRRGN